VTAPSPLRSAEEIAREMVPDAGWLQLGTDGVRLASDVSVPHARDIIARLIEHRDAEHAAAERERQAALSQETQAEQEARHRRAMSAAREAAYEDGLYREEQPRDLAGVSRATNCGTCLASLDEGGHRQGCDEPRRAAERQREESVLLAARRWVAVAGRNGAAEEQIDADMALTEAVEALAGAPEKPRYLAGRIRALVQEYAGRWADTERSDVSRRDSIMEIMRALRQALADVRSVADPMHRVHQLREDAFGDALMIQAADELEAIVRECGEAGR
jgi:hypothetical protein